MIPPTDYFNQSNQLITEILKSASAAVSENWETIILTTTYSSPPGAPIVVDVQSVYYVDNQPKQFQTPASIGLKLINLAKISSSPQKGNLTKAIFTIQKSGKFDVKYEY